MEMLTSALNTNIDVKTESVLRSMSRSPEQLDPELFALKGNLTNVLLAYSRYESSIGPS
jgi:hypothetical protein